MNTKVGKPQSNQSSARKEIRNVLRWYLLPKALTKYTKKYGGFNDSEISILTAFKCLGGDLEPVTISKVITCLKRVNRSPNCDYVYGKAVEMAQLGYLVPVESKMISYKLSVEGINWLFGLERVLRKERWNR